MILDAILTLLSNLVNMLLAPLEVINIGIDLIASIPVVSGFLQVVAYIFPWSNILPIIVITIVLLNFRIVISAIKLVLNILPFF